MLSGETAKGKFPREAVEVMSRIIVQAERCFDSNAHFLSMRELVLEKRTSFGQTGVLEVLASTAVESAINVKAPLIAVVSDSGKLPVKIAKFRPRARVLAITRSKRVMRQMNVSRGVDAIYVAHMTSVESAWSQVEARAIAYGWAAPGDRIVLVDVKNSPEFDQPTQADVEAEQLNAPLRQGALLDLLDTRRNDMVRVLELALF